jgi:hypothetical protein
LRIDEYCNGLGGKVEGVKGIVSKGERILRISYVRRTVLGNFIRYIYKRRFPEKHIVCIKEEGRDISGICRVCT